MTATELRAALSRLGYSQSAFARLVGVDARTVRRWLSGRQALPPQWVPLVLRLLELVPETVISD